MPTKANFIPKFLKIYADWFKYPPFFVRKERNTANLWEMSCFLILKNFQKFSNLFDIMVSGRWFIICSKNLIGKF